MEQEMEQEWIFTFGFGHCDNNGAPLRYCFVRIRGTHDEARTEMSGASGGSGRCTYPSEAEAGVARYGLTEYRPQVTA